MGGRDREGMNGRSEEDVGKPLCEKSYLLPGNAIRKQYQDTDLHFHLAVDINQNKPFPLRVASVMVLNCSNKNPKTPNLRYI